MSIALDSIMGKHVASAPLIAHAAATATETLPIFYAHHSCRIHKVVLVSGTAVTGANTDTTHINLQSITGVTATERANYDLTSGNNITANTPGGLYEPATPLNLAAGDRLNIQYEKVGNGLLVPSVTYFVVYTVEDASAENDPAAVA